MLSKVGCSAATTMVGRVWVGGQWNGGWFWSEAWGKPSSRWSHWLIRLGGIVRIVFGL
jgi:hypothetical protein